MARDGVDDTQTADADATTSRRAFTAVEDADGDSERQCSVCMSDFTQRVLLKECGHPFCHDCIAQWALATREAACPLCKVPLSVMVYDDGREQLVVLGTRTLADTAEAADLGCLDHTYFVAEIRRLQSRAQAVRERVSSAAFGCQRSSALAQADQAYMALMEIVCSLDDYLQDMQALRTFDPECVLAALYSMEGVVRAIAEGSWEPTARHCPQPPTRYSAEDAAGGELYEEEVLWEDHYDYADDYYEDSRPLGRGRYGGGGGGRKGSRGGVLRDGTASSPGGSGAGSFGRSPSSYTGRHSPKVVATRGGNGQVAGSSPGGSFGARAWADVGGSSGGEAADGAARVKSKNEKRRDKKRAAAAAAAAAGSAGGAKAKAQEQAQAEVKLGGERASVDYEMMSAAMDVALVIVD